mgnify:CR=1 FL=1
MNIIICDDENIFCEQVKNAVEDFFGKLDCTCYTYNDGSDVIEAYKKGLSMDALFLDIEMNSLDGMSTAKMLRDSGCEAPIIFLTSHTEMAMDGYEVQAFRFLGKPIVKEKMDKTLISLKETHFEKKRLIIHCDGEDIVILTDDIIFIEAMNNSINIILEDKDYTIRKKLSDIQEELNEISDDFYRIHRGYLVNLSHVKKHQSKEVLLSNGVSLPISRSEAVAFKDRLFEYVRNSAF